GTVAGSFLAQKFHDNPAIAGLIYGACSLFGLGASFLIARVPAGDPSKKFRFNIFGDLGEKWQLVRPDRALKLAIIGNTYFLSLPGLSFSQVLWLLVALGFAGGFFIVPISALIQHRPAEDKKGGVIAYANWLSFVGVILASAIFSGFTHYLHIGLGTFFAATAIISFGAAVYTVWLLPD